MLQIEYAAQKARELLSRPEVVDAMAIRCEEQGHEWEGGIVGILTVVRVCKWCGDMRAVG